MRYAIGKTVQRLAAWLLGLVVAVLVLPFGFAGEDEGMKSLESFTPEILQTVERDRVQQGTVETTASEG